MRLLADRAAPAAARPKSGGVAAGSDRSGSGGLRAGLRGGRGQELRLPGERDPAAAAVPGLHLGEGRDGLADLIVHALSTIDFHGQIHAQSCI
jgi:hypothetical protein